MSTFEEKQCNNFGELISYIIEKKKQGYIWYRGMSSSSYNLNSSLYRVSTNHNEILSKERELYFYFKSLGNDFLNHGEYSSWNQLFLMQHYGIPTRLLDWTSNFSVALYFSLERQIREINNGSPPCIWLLNPQKLNINESIAELYDRDEDKNLNIGLIALDHLPKRILDYKMYFNDNDLSVRSFALFSNRNSERIIKQSGFFTVQGTINQPMEKEISNDSLIKILINPDLINECISFLEINQVNRYTLFGGLDGLSHYIKDELMKIKMTNT